MNNYSLLSPEEQEELFSNFLIESWSFSKVSTFARNEKVFEMNYIYREKSRQSATTVAGSAYHAALQYYFSELHEGVIAEQPDLETEAFAYIDNVKANEWKIQKTTPTVEDCITKANKSVVALIKNFYQEQYIYMDDLQEVISVEMALDEWITVNGVDIPLPCHAKIDLVIRLNDGRVVIIDHKTKSQYTPDDEITFSFGKQAITYVLCFENRTGIKVDEVWFVENKDSANKDKSPQIRKCVIKMDENTRKLYQALLYEPLKRMIEAVSNPDYVYMINDADSFVDKAELYQFWVKTMLAEVDDFNVPENKKDLIEKRLKKIRDASVASVSPNVIRKFKEEAATFIKYDLTNTNMTNKEKIEHVLRTFGIVSQVAYELGEFSSKTYLLEFNAGTKLGIIEKYKMDIANALNVPSVRIGENLMVYEGKSYLYIEVSQKSDKILEWDKKYLQPGKIPVGVDNFGQTVFWDLNNHSTPHILICGATGSGKSVCIKSTIDFALADGIQDIYIMDPKYEFCDYEDVPGIHVYNDIDDIELQMAILVEDMQNRAKTQRGRGASQKTLVIFDEFADAVSSARSGKQLAPGEKSLEENLKMLLQKGRSLGFRILAATQRASTKVITGDAKVNFPVQICFRVPKAIDSKVVLDEEGAETLNGRGDGLMKSPDYLNTVRFQGFFNS